LVRSRIIARRSSPSWLIRLSLKSSPSSSTIESTSPQAPRTSSPTYSTRSFHLPRTFASASPDSARPTVPTPPRRAISISATRLSPRMSPRRFLQLTLGTLRGGCLRGRAGVCGRAGRR
jgi:hypothetical protein